MQTAPPPILACPICGTAGETNEICPHCKTSEDWTEQIQAVDFLVRRLDEWQQAGRLTDRQLKVMSERYARDRQFMVEASKAGRPFEKHPSFPPPDICWSCKEAFTAEPAWCDHCGAPLASAAVKSVRSYRFVLRELDDLEHHGEITLRQCHDLSSEVQGRLNALKGKLERERAAPVEPAVGSSIERAPAGPRRSLMEIALDPRTINWLLASGGGLVVLGLVIWLSSLGLFENPGFVAILLGVGNGLLLAGGLALIQFTRYQLAGRALTLLACLVMPLNLWFYASYNLVTIEGHLWVAALVCCAVYAVSAVALKDPLFVYVLVAGITLTGILLLGDIHHLDEILAPSAMLVILALVCLHAERAFTPADDTPFSRRRFGMAFYWSSQVLLAAGLLILLCAQFIGLLHEPVLQHLGIAKPAVAELAMLPYTLALVLAGTYAYVYSDVVVRRIGVYIYLAAITLLWAEVQLLALLNLTGNEPVVIITLALTALIVNVLQSAFEEKSPFLRAVPPLGILLSLVPVAIGIALHFRATNSILARDLGWGFEITWAQVGAMAVTALCCRAGAHLYRRSFPELSAAYFFVTAAATLVFAASLAWMIGLKPWETEAPVLMAIPIIYLVAAHLYRGHTPEVPLVWCAHLSAAVMVICSVYTALGITPQVVERISGDRLNLLLALFCLEVAFFYGLAAALRKEGWNVYLATVMLCGALWQLLTFFHLPDEYYAVAFSVIGLGLLVTYRFAVLESLQSAGLNRSIYASANALTTLGFVAGALLSLTRLLSGPDALRRLDPAGEWHNPLKLMIGVLALLTVVSLLAAWLVQQHGWRRLYIVLAVLNGLLIGLTFHKMSVLDTWQKLEIFGVVVGLGLLTLGFIGWYRENDEETSDMASFGLAFGSLALVLPLFIATVIHRFYIERISPIDELGLVAACIALLGSGIVCRIKSTTLVGSLAMALYILMVLIYMHRFLREQIIVGIYLTLGGALLFGTGLLLSVYRDRLLALPDKVKRREGIFRVFGWR